MSTSDFFHFLESTMSMLLQHRHIHALQVQIVIIVITKLAGKVNCLHDGGPSNSSNISNQYCDDTEAVQKKN